MKRWFWRRRQASGFDSCVTDDDLFAEMERKLGVLRQIKYKTVMASNKPPSVIAEQESYIREGEQLLATARLRRTR